MLYSAAFDTDIANRINRLRIAIRKSRQSMGETDKDLNDVLKVLEPNAILKNGNGIISKQDKGYKSENGGEMDGNDDDVMIYDGRRTFL